MTTLNWRTRAFAGTALMPLKLFELVGTDEARPFSPFCWRTRMALAHKGLSAETIPWCFTEKDAIAPHNSEKVPVLIGGAGGRAMGRMINWWGDVTVIGGMFPLIVADIPGHLKPVDAVYFRQSREARFGKPLEEVMAGREKTVEGFRRSLDPMRLTLKTQAYLGGDAPNYADHIVFGGFQWARVVSPFRLLAENDPVHAWRASRRAIRCRVPRPSWCFGCDVPTDIDKCPAPRPCCRRCM